MIYELINPHDKCTFEAPDAQVAALVCLVIGGGNYGADADTDDVLDNWGVHLFSSGDEVEAEFRQRWEQGIDTSVRVRKPEVVVALRSLTLASRAERAGIVAAMEACPTEESRAAFVAAYEDKKRSSMTNLTKRARVLADKFEETADDEEKWSVT